MNRRVTIFSEVKGRGLEPKRKRVLIAREVKCRRPEAWRSIHEQDEAAVRRRGGPNHTYVEKCGDDLWIAEKFQSSWAIAGSPRNSFRASVRE